jgi:hypothetical protein
VVDLFDEVEGELRTEQYKRLALKILPWVIGGLVVGLVLVGVILGTLRYQETTQAKAADAYQAALELRDNGDLKGAHDAFAQLGEEGPKGYRALALMQQGAIRLNEGRTKEAVALFDAAAEVAPGGELGYILSDNARLKSAFALLDEAPYADIEGRLTPLTADDRPYRALAKEALAMAKLNAGKIAEARTDFNALTLSIDAPQETTERARAAVALIDSGGASAVPAAVKAAKTVVLPMPQAPMPPGQMMQPTPATPAPRAVQ